MTDEQLELEIKALDTELEGLAKQGKLPRKQATHRHVLRLRKDVLLRIKEMRGQQKTRDETHDLMIYHMLLSVGEKYPLLIPLMMARLRWGFI